jgi:hypothetical protein
MRTSLWRTAAHAAFVVAIAGGAHAQEAAPDAGRHAFFGDLHLHTSNSFDAASVGITMTRDDAYRFAQGETIEYMDRMVRRQVPLDFLAVTDHSEYMGVLPALRDPDGPFPELSAQLAQEEADGPTGMQPGQGLMARIMGSGFRDNPPVAELVSEPVKEMNWDAVVDAAERFYQPGEFTSFIAYEWSPTPNGNHFHRNVIFRGPDYPSSAFSSIDSPRPEDLYAYADRHRDAGIDSVIIPHNPNLSGGMTFADSDGDGGLMTRDFAEMRARNEVLAEITQIKGTSETHPDLSPDDPFANFEIVEHFQQGQRRPLEGSYLRDAYGRGLEIAARTGIDPFKFGLVGSTDSHASMSNSEEDNYVGSLGENDDPVQAEFLLTRMNPVLSAPTAVISSSGLTGIWAEENTRESLFAALKRKETFATSGPLIQVRFFAGWAYGEDMLSDPDWVETAYESGFPMGADVTAAADEARPLRFLVEAAKDPNGANLDRIQIVKVWYADGESHEKVFDVAWSGDRAADDPEFDPAAPAVYYARVIEIPTPRWSTYLAVRNNLPLPETLPATLQERAWTSPIFYTPADER